MEATTVIRRPLITEKSTAGTEHNRVAFEVDSRATKKEIRRAVESLYSVRVLSVATMNRRGEIKRYKYGAVQLPTVKRAIVKVHPEDKIELF